MMSLRIDLNKVGNNPRSSFAIITGTVLFCSAVSIITIFAWLLSNPTRDFQAEVPGKDGAPAPGSISSAKIDLAGIFETFDGQPSQLGGAWTNFRGPDSNNIAVDAPKLADSWGAEGPKVVWSTPVGDGYASPVILDGRVFLMDYDVKKRADAIRCFSLDDGREIWRRSYGINIKRNHGMSRTIPAVTKDYLVVMGPKCQVVCVDTATGDFRWGIDLQQEYGTTEPLWYTGQCPIIDDGKVILAPCGKDVLMMAVDCKTGDVVWKTPNPHGWNMSHASVVPMTVLGEKSYVYGALGGMAGVSASPETAGKLLWELPWDAKVVAPSPVKAGEDLIFATAGYGRGSRLLKLSKSGATMNAEIVYDKPPEQILSCEQQTPIFYNGLLYGIMPKDAGALKGQFVCYRPDGTLVWSSGQDNRFGLGPFLLADNKFLLLGDDGVLTMADATKQEFVQLGQAAVLKGHDAWGPLALAGTRLLLRDMNTLACVDLGV
ncbi:MAG: PQQ-binding-like beta-propeller repeat protein [Candidatus Hydrogenedentales bacterium]|jgi:outer membrane protein assembly factor BamB